MLEDSLSHRKLFCGITHPCCPVKQEGISQLCPSSRGVGAMEIVAMDMKVSGMYIARQLSFTGVTFRIEEIPLDQQYKIVYDKAAKLVSQSHCSGETSV